MTEPDATQDDAELSSARDAWLEVSDDLLAGVGHTLNNRIAALTAVGQVLAATTEGPLTSALSAESSRLQRAVQLLRLLVRRWESEPEPIQIDDVLRDVVELLSHHPDVRNTTVHVQGAAGLAPVWSERSLLTHAFCILLTVAAKAAEQAGEAELPVQCSGTMEQIRIEIAFPSDATNLELADQSTEPLYVSRIDPRNVQGLIRRSGGEVSVRREAGAPTTISVRLPTLMEVRRRERMG